MTPKLAKRPSPEELFHEALTQNDLPLSSEDLRLLTSGLIALRETRENPLNAIEKKAILSLISYVAYSQNAAEETVQAVLLARFGAKDFPSLPSRLYDDMVEYLVNLEMNEIVN